MNEIENNSFKSRCSYKKHVYTMYTYSVLSQRQIKIFWAPKCRPVGQNTRVDLRNNFDCCCYCCCWCCCFDKRRVWSRRRWWEMKRIYKANWEKKKRCCLFPLKENNRNFENDFLHVIWDKTSQGVRFFQNYNIRIRKTIWNSILYLVFKYETRCATIQKKF